MELLLILAIEQPMMKMGKAAAAKIATKPMIE